VARLAWEYQVTRALIIDDESGIRFALKRWFERQQYVVLEAGDGNAAMEHIVAEGDALRVIVCDLHLPGLNGDALISRLAVEYPALVSRVILTTGDAVDDAPSNSVLARHPFVLQKPFDLATLKQVVERVVAS
jgi:DNA-binding NtrC family response regulator